MVEFKIWENGKGVIEIGRGGVIESGRGSNLRRLFFKYFCAGTRAPPIPALYFVLFFCIFDFLPYPGYPRIGLPENWMPDSVRTFTCCLVSEIQTLGLFSPYFASVYPEDF